MQDHIQKLRSSVGCEYRGYVDEAVCQDPGQKAPALVKNERKDKADGDREDHLAERLGQTLSGKQIKDMSEPEGDGGDDDSRFDAAVLQHRFEQEAPEEQLLRKSDQSHGDGGTDQSRQRVIRREAAEKIHTGDDPQRNEPQHGFAVLRPSGKTVLLHEAVPAHKQEHCRGERDQAEHLPRRIEPEIAFQRPHADDVDHDPQDRKGDLAFFIQAFHACSPPAQPRAKRRSRPASGAPRSVFHHIPDRCWQ